MAYILSIGTLLAGMSEGFTVAQSPTPAKPDPIVGKWHWSDNGSLPSVTEILADGTAHLTDHNGLKRRWVDMTGTWKLLPSDAAERHYEIHWDNDMWIDNISLSQDGNLVYGENNKHEHIRGKRFTEEVPGATP